MKSPNININKKGSKRVAEPNRLSIYYNKHKKYLNISVCLKNSAGMAEWLSQSTVNRCPSGREVSSPSAGVLNIFDNKKLNINKQIKI